MIKHTLAAALLAVCSLSAMAQSAPVAPAAGAGAGAHKVDPAKFAARKQALLDQRAKTTSCIQAASEPKGVMECMKAEHEAMKAMHGDHAGRPGLGQGVPAKQ